MSNKYSSAKKDFLKNEMWILAWGGASQRANIFPSKMSEKTERFIEMKLKKLYSKFLISLNQLK